jgi:hypothetical protein
MKFLSIRAVGSLFGIALFAFPAMAVRLPTSTLVVQVLSVEQVSFNREPAMISQGRVVGDRWLETTGFIAKVQILNVIRTDHGLAPGETIEIGYKIRTATPQPSSFHDAPLKQGENVTLEVMGGNGRYERR